MAPRSMLLVVVLLAASLVLGALDAAAQPPEPDRTPLDGVPVDVADKAQKFAASEYHEAGMTAWRENRFADALPLFRKAYGLVRRADTRLMIARTLDARGRSAAAYREALETAAEASPPVDAQAKQLIEALEKKVGLVTVRIGGGGEQTAVVVNGKPLDRLAWGRPFPVLPGQVQVVATNTAGEVTESAIVGAGERKVIAIQAPAVEPVAAPAPAPASPPAAPEPVVSLQEDGTMPWLRRHRLTIGIATAAAGGIFLVNFGIFGVLADGQADRLETACPNPDDCDPRFSEDADEGKRFQTVANAMAGLGAVTLAAGAAFITWHLVDPDGPDERARIPRLRVGPGSLSVEGSF